MARPRSEAKRSAILRSAVKQITATGLGASTASIAKGANLAEGTVFTYFTTKGDLLNELYLELKAEVYRRVNTDFPHGTELRERARHVWTETLRWAMEMPDERNVSMQLSLSGIITDAVKKRAQKDSDAVAQTMEEISRCDAFKELPPGFASSVISAMQSAVVITAVRRPGDKADLIRKSFEAFWRMTS